MKRIICILAAAFAILFAAALPARAALVIDGLGTFRFSRRVLVTDGAGSGIETALRKKGSDADFIGSGDAIIAQFMFAPPGMNLFPKEGGGPWTKLHLYQITVSDVRGIYSSLLYVVRGKAEDFFRGKHKRAERYWEMAFSQDEDRPEGLFGGPKISPEEYQNFLNERLGGRRGTEKVEILTFNPWRGYKNGDGTVRWAQQCRAVTTTKEGLSFPRWVYSNLYRNGDEYFLLIFTGSHTSADKMGDAILGALYNIERSPT